MLALLRRVVLRGSMALALLACGLSGAAGAAGGGGGEGATPAKPEDAQYTAALKAIKAKEYARAIPLLEDVTQREPQNADAYNWLAYATRKNGDPAASIPIYEKALAIDPKHRGAHEYIGEAYLMLDQLPQAEQHLARLDSLCVFGCAEHRELKTAIANYKAGRKPTN